MMYTTPVNPNATPEATALLQYLHDIAGTNILAGQHTQTNVINLKRLLNGKQNVWKYQNGEEKSDSDGREKDV